MSNNEIKELALSLAKADTEKEVVELLKQAKYWDDDTAWREYGGSSNNYPIIGNQQSSADNALVEKLVNAVDAVLMKECLREEIAPDGGNAPKSIAEAQKKFFDIYDGKLSRIDEKQRAELAKRILLVATGSRTKPSLSIIDDGEGQTPQSIPETILSLTKDNKIKIPFVQGKFGMGGSGVLRFCSAEHRLQLVISKRSIDILQGEDETENFWGVTVVRREEPREGMRSSHWTYLAPDAQILSFEADELPLIPKSYPDAFGNPLKSGTYIKLYEYNIGAGLRTFIGFDLYYRLALLMPDIALPVRMLERRKNYKAHSYEKTLAGLSVRLDEDKSENLEPEFQRPATGTMSVEGQKFDYSIYVFKMGKKENYAKEGVLFSITGQTHGSLPKTFFERKAIGMSYLSNSILVAVDCSKITSRKQEELFMPSRDRLAKTAFRSSIQRDLEEIIKGHEGLKKLENKRRKEVIGKTSRDSKPLVDVLENIIKKSPTLSNLLGKGNRVKDPFDMEGSKEKDNPNGKEFPTYFNLAKDYTEEKPKDWPINRKKFRVQYETDAENDYFNRDRDPGELTLQMDGCAIEDYTLNLWNRLATLTISIPRDKNVGDLLYFKTEMSDITRPEPYLSEFWVRIVKESGTSGGHKGKRKPPPSDEKGSDRQKESHRALPNVIEVKQDEYEKHGFDKHSALKVMSSGEDGSGYDFYINMDNVYLQTEMKGNSKDAPEILKTRYKVGMVLLGISILHSEEKHTKEQDDSNGGVSVYERISQFTQAVSPTLLPMIASLGSLESEV